MGHRTKLGLAALVLAVSSAVVTCAFAQETSADGQAKQLTFGAGPDQCPAWSPDGRQIAFHSARTGNRDIWVVDVGGGEPKKLVSSDSDEGFPCWSPDGRKLAFLRHAGDARRGFGDVVVMDIAGKREEKLTSDQTAKFGVKWDRTGKSVLYGELIGSPRDFRVCIVRLDVAEKTRTEILKGHAGGVSQSPDGKRLAFDSMDDRTRRRVLYVVNLDDGRVNPIVTDMDRPWFPDWSPDGKWIAFHAGRGGWDGIWLVRPDGTERTKLFSSGEGDRFPAWSPDGKTVAFTRGTDERANIWLRTFAGSR